MNPLQKQLSQLEVEPLETLVDVPAPEQNSNLESLASSKAEADLTGILTLEKAIPAIIGLPGSLPPENKCCKTKKCCKCCKSKSK